MESVREKWTDERLDDLSRRVESGFNTLQQTTIGGFVALLAAMVVTNLG